MEMPSPPSSLEKYGEQFFVTSAESIHIGQNWILRKSESGDDTMEDESEEGVANMAFMPESPDQSKRNSADVVNVDDIKVTVVDVVDPVGKSQIWVSHTDSNLSLANSAVNSQLTTHTNISNTNLSTTNFTNPSMSCSHQADPNIRRVHIKGSVPINIHKSGVLPLGLPVIARKSSSVLTVDGATQTVFDNNRSIPKNGNSNPPAAGEPSHANNGASETKNVSSQKVKQRVTSTDR